MVYQNKKKNLKAFAEYRQLDLVTQWGTNTKIPYCKVINPCFIKTPFREEKKEAKPGEYYGLMIACDGYAMQKGLVEFWKLVVEENVKVITALNETFTRRDYSWADIFQYFPEDCETSINIGGVFILKTVKTVKSDQITTRHIQVFDQSFSKMVHQVKHIHFKVWDDFRVPKEENTGALLECLTEQADMLLEQVLNPANQVPQKVLLHCLAGRGRTCTAIACIQAIMALKYQMAIGEKELQLSIFSIVRRIREQRATGVQTEQQYEFIYRAVNQWIRGQGEKADFFEADK